MTLKSGTKLGPYEIRSPLGAGGMGEVYRATDSKLGRDVALKVLPTEMAQDSERLGRFRREAKSLAQLDHPNIVTIYSVEECDGVHFLTMQLVEGQPLDRLICADGLPLEQIVEIASALGDALAAAHEKGIVHRDLKPANVMVSKEGRVKVLDFGLAKDIGASNPADATLTSDHRTQVGVVMGTPAYMSPEQTSGRPLDHRTDIFSFGVLLHEMATGRRPFEGSSSAELVSAILRDTPPSVTDMRPDLPSDLARIVRRCLEKDPRHRLQTARDVSNEFRDMARTASRPTPVSTSAPRMVPPLESGAVHADEGFWVAVLPFKHAGSNPDLAALADGLTDDTITGLSKFSYLRVIARSSSSRYVGQSVDVRTAGKELNARYVMEATLRQAGSKLRLAVQLVDSISGAHLWAENYERPFSAETIFELQDDLVPRIVSTVADMNGVLTRSMSESVRSRNPEQLSPYEAVLRSFGYFERLTREDLATARFGLESAMRKAPASGDGWAMLALLCVQDYAQGFNLHADALANGLAAAQRAVNLAPSNHLAHYGLAQALFFLKEFQSFRNAAERAVALNPMDSNSIAFLGELLSYAGDGERGASLAARAKQLNPNHPGFYWFADFYNAYRHADYRAALGAALNLNLPGHMGAQMLLAAAYGQLGEREAAGKAVRDLLRLRPDFASIARGLLGQWWTPEYAEQLKEGWRKAGLEIADDPTKPSPELRSSPATAISTSAPPAAPPAKTDSGAFRADEGFWVAVLPFKYAGASAELKALADGLSEEVVTGLSRFSYLRVIARGSTAKYSSESGDIRAVGKELGARYVMEGNIRQAGTKLRLAVQLIDATTGAHLWAETYERGFYSEAAFELQDDLVPRIVSTVADMHGILPRSMSAAVRFKPSDRLTPYEALLRGFGHSVSFSPNDIVDVQSSLERALQQSPDNVDCLAMLAIVQGDAYGFSDRFAADILEGALRAAQAAVEAEPTNALAFHALAKVLFFKRNIPAFRAAADRAVSLNPMDGATIAYMGILMAFAGDWERGYRLTEKGMQLNANHPGWHLMTAWHDAYRRKDYPKALELALQLNAPKNPWVQRSLTVSYAQLGRNAEASSSLRDLLALVPNYAQVAHEMHSRWLEPELVEHMMGGLRKAGLETAEDPAKATLGSPASVTVTTSTDSGATRADEGFWVAVLSFKYPGNNRDLKALAEGLSEEIVTGLSRFSYLKVIARGSTSKYSSESGDVRAIGKELGARYVIEGSLRQAGAELRLAVQLVDAVSGAHLWAENYERTFSPDSIFALQDDLVPRIVSTVADQNGILPRRISEELRGKNEDALTPHEAVLRSFSFLQRISSTEHATARRILERAVERDPNQADAWAMLAIMYDSEFADEYNPRPNPLERATAAAQRAVDLAPTHALGYYALAFTYFFRRDKDNAGFLAAVEQAIALNPMDGSVMGLLGLLVHHAGEIERGTQMVEAAMQLNPHYPPVFRAPAFLNAYAQGKYAEALALAVRFNMPGFFHAHAVRAAALGQLGQREAGQQAVQELLAVRPDFATSVRRDYGKWWDAKMVDHLVEGLRKAGLEIADDPAKPGPQASVTSAIESDAKRAALQEEAGFWVAVLPFKHSGNNPDLAALAEGLSEDIVTGLSRFSYLRVIARGSTLRYANQAVDIRDAAKELGARYVMEGSLRQAGATLRVAVQLVDATTGAHLWAENYERTFSPENIFALQDDMVPRIVSTVADYYGILPHTISDALRRQNADDQLSPYEAVLRAFSYFERITPEEHAHVRQILESAARSAPDQGEIWAMLSTMYWHEHAFGFNLQPDPLGRALAAARRSVDAAPTNNLGHSALAVTLFYQKNKLAFRPAAERAIELNRMDGSNLATMGSLMAYAGDWEQGCGLVESALRLNPHHPGWYWFAHYFNAYRKGDYRGALNIALKFNMPGYFYSHALTAAVYGQLGLREQAHEALQELLALRPDFAVVARKEFEKSHDPELVAHLIDGLCKAGLEVPDLEAPGKDAPFPAPGSRE
jgi:TolB-like protein/Flp pilus assembly protein TadD